MPHAEVPEPHRIGAGSRMAFEGGDGLCSQHTRRPGPLVS